MEMDYELLRRYAGYADTGLTLAQAKEAGFVQDANDEMLWNEAAANIDKYTADSPDSEIVNPTTYDEATWDLIWSRVSALLNEGN